ncbi:FlgD immunoglobulin-like domain containing protein [Hydrogenimonas sp.]
MDVTNTLTTPTALPTTTDTVQNPDGILGKDDFLQLLLIEMRYQDPTDPMDTEKILSQTSELASLEASENTNKALEDLAASLGTSQNLTAVSAIGKIADLGNDDIRLDESGSTFFDLYLPDPVASGIFTITDSSGNVVKTIGLENLDQGVQAFEWDGTDDQGQRVESGIYHGSISYLNPDGESVESRVGLYPIESVRFENGEAYFKLGNSYVPMLQVKEIYGG